MTNFGNLVLANVIFTVLLHYSGSIRTCADFVTSRQISFSLTFDTIFRCDLPFAIRTVYCVFRI